MIIVVLGVLGLCVGSFVNALVWRLHEQAEGKGSPAYKAKLSITTGRSMCPHCHHELAPRDLIPVFSWLMLRGRCRYCHEKIEDSPLVELLAVVAFLASYVWWPYVLHGVGLYDFIFWLIFLIGFLALAVYDLRWQILPNKLVFPLIGLAVARLIGLLIFFGGGWQAAAGAAWGVLIASGIFYVIFQLSQGEWIGGGDVKLGLVIGLLLGGPAMSLLMLFFASCIGSLIGLPSLLAGKRQMRLPFGPFLILATLIVTLVGASLISWY
jgi:leader peptidase (prepilin peptidase)/N-methyltransferase